MRSQTIFYNTAPYEPSRTISVIEKFHNVKLSAKKKEVIRRSHHFHNADILAMPDLTVSQKHCYYSLAKIVCRKVSTCESIVLSTETTAEEQDEACDILFMLPSIDQMKMIAKRFCA
jgi:hypothetical protein